jgi:hypothetical protein
MEVLSILRKDFQQPELLVPDSAFPQAPATLSHWRHIFVAVVLESTM